MQIMPNGRVKIQNFETGEFKEVSPQELDGYGPGLYDQYKKIKPVAAPASAQSYLSQNQNTGTTDGFIGPMPNTNIDQSQSFGGSFGSSGYFNMDPEEVDPSNFRSQLQLQSGGKSYITDPYTGENIAEIPSVPGQAMTGLPSGIDWSNWGNPFSQNKLNGVLPQGGR